MQRELTSNFRCMRPRAGVESGGAAHRAAPPRVSACQRDSVLVPARVEKLGLVGVELLEGRLEVLNLLLVRVLRIL